MTVGLVIVSHSARLAEGVVELAREMGGEEVAIEAAGGMAEPAGAMGTDAELVMAAIERASSPDGVLVLMDLGSALMSAEMAVEMSAGDVRVVLADAPLVEGAVAAAAAARGGAALDEVAAEARGSLRAKAAQSTPMSPTSPATRPSPRPAVTTTARARSCGWSSRTASACTRGPPRASSARRRAPTRASRCATRRGAAAR